MLFEHREFSLVLGSDVARDGMYLELKEGCEPTGRLLAEWFYSDVDGTLSLTVYATAIPTPVLDWFRQEAARRLPPERSAV